MGVWVDAQVNVNDVANGFRYDPDEAFNLVAGLSERINDVEWDERVIAMLKEA